MAACTIRKGIYTSKKQSDKKTSDFFLLRLEISALYQRKKRNPDGEIRQNR